MRKTTNFAININYKIELQLNVVFCKIKSVMSMLVYRVIEKDKYESGSLTNSNWSGVNTFNYDKEEYLHFFLLPESASIFQKLRYTNCKIDSIATKWDIPYELIKDNFGAGMYKYYDSIALSPFLEVKVKKNNLKKEMLVECSETFDEWFDEEIYSRYMESVVEAGKNFYRIKNFQEVVLVDYNKGSIIEQISQKPKLNPQFNFLNYFPKSELDKEGLESDYYIEPDYNNVKVESISDKLKDRIKSLFSKKKR